VPREVETEYQCLLILFSRWWDESIYSRFWGGGIRTSSSNMEQPIRTRKDKLAVLKRQARRRTEWCGASQTKGWMKSAHLSSVAQIPSLTMMKRNRKRRSTEKTKAKLERVHIMGRAYNTGHVGSRSIFCVILPVSCTSVRNKT